MAGFVILCIILIGVVLTVNLVIADKFEKIAFQKGYDSSIHSYAMCFWLGMVGYLYVIALPDLKLKGTVKKVLDTKKEQHQEQ